MLNIQYLIYNFQRKLIGQSTVKITFSVNVNNPIKNSQNKSIKYFNLPENNFVVKCLWDHINEETCLEEVTG